MNYRVLLMAIALCAILAGCDVKTEADIYLSDMLSVTQSGQPEKVNIRYLVEVPTEDKCRLYSQQIGDIIKPEMAEFSGVSCERAGFENFAVVSGKTNLVRSDPNGNVTFHGVTALATISPSHENVTYLKIVVSKSAFDRLTAQTKRLMDSPFFDATISKIQITLDNDTKNDFIATVMAGTVNNDPTIAEYVTFKSRTKVVIVESDIHSKALQKNGFVELLRWNKQPAPSNQSPPPEPSLQQSRFENTRSSQVGMWYPDGEGPASCTNKESNRLVYEQNVVTGADGPQDKCNIVRISDSESADIDSKKYTIRAITISCISSDDGAYHDATDIIGFNSSELIRLTRLVGHSGNLTRLHYHRCN